MNTRAIGAALLLFVPVTVLAHPGHEHGLLHGLWHALSGVAPLLAALGVGLPWLVRARRPRWLQPSEMSSANGSGSRPRNAW